MAEIKVPGEIELRGDEVCTEEGCGRPAVDGVERRDGTKGYRCTPHLEIGLLQGQLDWLDGEISTLKDWQEQAKKQADGRSWIVLTHEYGDKKVDPRYLPHLDPWVLSFEGLLAAVGLAEKLTRERIERKEAGLSE